MKPENTEVLLKPSQVAANLEEAIQTCRQLHRMTPVAYSLDIAAEGDAYYEQFHACCRLAKATKVVCLCVPSSEIGTPFNGEVERLRELVRVDPATPKLLKRLASEGLDPTKVIDDAHKLAHLSDIDREIIIRWMTRDFRVVFAGDLVPPKR